MYEDSVEAFASAAAIDILATLHSRAMSGNTYLQMIQQFLGPDGLARLQNCLARALGQGNASFPAIERVLKVNQQQISAPHGLGADLQFQLLGVVVIVTIIRR